MTDISSSSLRRDYSQFLSQKPQRRKEEFYCDVAGEGCGKYFLTFLRSDMTGNYAIKCPGCGHIHYRVITEGLVTKDRHHRRSVGEVEVLVGLLSTLQDAPWHDDPEFKRMQLKLYRPDLTPEQITEICNGTSQ